VARALPIRGEPGNRNFSPWIDRFCLLVISSIAILCMEVVASFLEQWLGSNSLPLTVCGLLVLVPILSTSLGKLIVRILL